MSSQLQRTPFSFHSISVAPLMSLESAESIFARANALHVDEDFTQASTLYDEALELEPTKSEYLLARAANSIKLRRFQSAAADTARVVAAQPQNANAHFRNGVANFNLDLFAQAKASFENANKLGKSDAALWIRKCDAELADAPSAAPSATPAPVSAPAPAPVPVPTASAVAAEAAPVRTLAEQIKPHSWLQSDMQVSLTVYAKNIPTEQVSVTFDARRCSVRLVCADASVYERAFELTRDIVPAESSYRVTAYKVEISLKKCEKAQWLALEVTDPISDSMGAKSVSVATPSTDKPMAYPTSSKVKRDWTSVDKEVQKMEEEEKPEGDAALNKLFQQIYKNGTEVCVNSLIQNHNID
jgi:suppressor of G2 allele of SKP1